MSMPPLTRIAQALPDTVPFVAPETLERRSGVRIRARVGANESSFGPSPRVIQAMREAAPSVWQYGDPEMLELRTALAALLGVPLASLAVGEGIDGLHGLIARLLIAPGDVAVTSLGAYPTFNYHVAGFGGRIVAVPYTADDREDLEVLAATARREQAKVVYLSNPDNPMGSWWDTSNLHGFLDSVPETTLVLLDEAYSETAPAAALPPLLKGYLRLGAKIGDGAVVDAQFNTTDVCIVLQTARLTQRCLRHYREQFGAQEAA